MPKYKMSILARKLPSNRNYQKAIVVVQNVILASLPQGGEGVFGPKTNRSYRENITISALTLPKNVKNFWSLVIFPVPPNFIRSLAPMAARTLLLSHKLLRHAYSLRGFFLTFWPLYGFREKFKKKC